MFKKLSTVGNYLLIVFSGEYPELAHAECKALLVNNEKLSSISDRVVLVFSNNHNKTVRQLQKAAYITTIAELICVSDLSSIEETVRKKSLRKWYQNNFAVRKLAFEESISTKKCAKIIWNALDTQQLMPKVNLADPKTTFLFVFLNKKVYLTSLCTKEKEPFAKRRAHLRPALSPISLQPKLARAMVNLANHGTHLLVDPCCGTGGILIEAGLLGYACRGYDIDINVVNKARKNIQHYKLDIPITPSNMLVVHEPWPTVVTELPFGKNTSVEGTLTQLYKSFLQQLHINGTKKAVFALPDGLQLSITHYGFYVQHSFRIRLHKSLSKKILVIERKE